MLLDVGSNGLDPGPVGWRPLFFMVLAPEELCTARLGTGRQLLCRIDNCFWLTFYSGTH